jgi:hypothetical protein
MKKSSYTRRNSAANLHLIQSPKNAASTVTLLKLWFSRLLWEAVQHKLPIYVLNSSFKLLYEMGGSKQPCP